MGIVPRIVHKRPGESPVPRCFIENRARWVRNCAWAKNPVFLEPAGSTKAAGSGCLASIGPVCLRGACYLVSTQAVAPPVPRCLIEDRARWVRNCPWAQNGHRAKIRCFWNLLGPQKHPEVGVWLRLERAICHGTVILSDAAFSG